MGYGLGIPGGSGGSGSSSSGSVVGSARYDRISTAQPIPNTTLTLFNFDTESYDTLTKGAVATGASWRYTASDSVKVTLKLDFRTSSAANISAAGRLHYAQIFVSGVAQNLLDVWQNHLVQSASTVYLDGTSTPIQLSAGQYVDVRLYHAQGSSVDWKGTLEITEE